MKAIYTNTSIVLFILFLYACDENKYGSISGKVTDSKTYSAIQNVQITTSPPSISILTDNDGRFRFDSLESDCTYTVFASRSGYDKEQISIRVKKNSISNCAIQLKPQLENSFNFNNSQSNNNDLTGIWVGRSHLITNAPETGCNQKLILRKENGSIKGIAFEDCCYSKSHYHSLVDLSIIDNEHIRIHFIDYNNLKCIFKLSSDRTFMSGTNKNIYNVDFYMELRKLNY